MNKPKLFTVRVLGCDFKLKPGTAAELRGKWGRCDFQNRTIIYADHIHESAIREVIFHELLHLADSSVSTDKTELTEEQVNRVSAVLFGILNDHYALVNWLFAHKSEM